MLERTWPGSDACAIGADVGVESGFFDPQVSSLTRRQESFKRHCCTNRPVVGRNRQAEAGRRNQQSLQFK